HRNLEWVRQNWSEYRGQWVAVSDGVFLHAAEWRDELDLPLLGIPTDQQRFLMIVRMPDDQEAKNGGST
ncbi:hypothetical protein RGC28_08315, partial [Helicobacter pylori]|uniref:hypothetical protein n=1 Tax=Helicobacter pylori TaxID=210 RepID=UPI00292A333A